MYIYILIYIYKDLEGGLSRVRARVARDHLCQVPPVVSVHLQVEHLTFAQTRQFRSYSARKSATPCQVHRQ